MSTTDSILNSTKLMLGLTEDYTPFDPVVTMHINSIFSVLNGLGIGPVDGFMIEGPGETWGQFLGPGLLMNEAKTYMYLRVRMIFDPPQIGYLIDSYAKQIAEFEFRLNVTREGESWTPPN